jgi:hypothetical protein
MVVITDVREARMSRDAPELNGEEPPPAGYSFLWLVMNDGSRLRIYDRNKWGGRELVFLDQFDELTWRARGVD